MYQAYTQAHVRTKHTHRHMYIPSIRTGTCTYQAYAQWILSIKTTLGQQSPVFETGDPYKKCISIIEVNRGWDYGGLNKQVGLVQSYSDIGIGISEIGLSSVIKVHQWSGKDFQ